MSLPTHLPERIPVLSMQTPTLIRIQAVVHHFEQMVYVHVPITAPIYVRA